MKYQSTIWLSMIFLLFSISAIAAEDEITGTVTAASNGDLLPGAVVMLKGTSSGTLTNEDGHYRISAEKGDTLLFTMLGYEDEIVVFEGQATIDVALKEIETKLDEAIVIGYGSIKKKDMTGSISTIDGSALKNYPATDFSQMLAGRAAGVEGVSVSGKPGATAAIRIRGIGTVNSSSPLYVVDGVPLNSSSDLDPRSIESMQILKDASATAIYGSRGSNGVILITTKKSQSCELNVSFDAYVGFEKLFVKYKPASSTQLFDFYLEQSRNDGVSPDPRVQRLYERGYNTDWLDLCTQTGITQNYSLLASGGSDKFKTTFQVTYIDQLGTMKKNTFNKINLRSYNEYTPNSWLKVAATLGIGYSKTENSLCNLDVLLTADPFTTPINPLADPADPNYFYNKYTPTEFSWNTNPLSLLAQSNEYVKEFNPYGNAYIDIRLFDGLYFKSQAAFEKTNYNTRKFEPYYSLIPSEDDTEWNSEKYREENKISVSNGSTLYINLEQTLRYDKTINRHSVNAVVGLTYEKWNSESVSGTRTGIPSNDEVFWTLDAATGLNDIASGGINEEAMISYLGRVNYSYDSRYMATVSFRADGSSEFAPGNRWGYFPSFSLGWNISNEKFFLDNVSSSLVSQLKLRAGWGATGNKNAASRSQIVSLMGQWRGVDYAFGRDVTDPLKAVLPNTRGNSLLRWETGQQYNVGIDLTMFDSKLNVNMDYYSKYTNDMILTMDLPIYAQFPSSPKANMGSMRNNGFELTVSWGDTIGDFSYGVSANVSAYKSIVKSLGENPDYWSGDVSKSIVGAEFGRFYMLEYLGIFQTQREIDMYVNDEGKMIQPLAQPGDFKFADRDGDGQITDNDRTFMGTPQPDCSFGLNFYLGWKNFDLTLFFNGQFGNQIYNSSKSFYGKLTKCNILVDLYENSWRKEGDLAKYPRITGTDLNSNYKNSSWYLEDGSYVKLRNVQLGYTFPEKLIQRSKIFKGFRIYVSGQNLFTFTKYTGFDPEVGFDGIEDPRRYIPGRTIIAGLNINF